MFIISQYYFYDYLKEFLLSANVTHRINDLERLLNVSYLREVIVPEIERMVKESNIDSLYDDARQFINTTFLLENVIPEIEKVWFVLTMNHSPFRHTFELGIVISTAGKSILNLVKWRSLVAKCRKMWKIYLCEVCKFCILLYYARKSVITFRNLITFFHA